MLETAVAAPPGPEGLAITFLGHQGWLFEAGGHAIVIDGLLGGGFGTGAGVEGAALYPPRQLKPAHLPAIDAVLITHEHEDHFDVESLLQIDRNIPIYLSYRCSTAATRFLAELGFAVHALVPGKTLQCGPLEVLPLSQPIGLDHPGEWDTICLCVRDLRGHGSWCSTVDLRPDPTLLRELARRHLQPQIWTWPDNYMDFGWIRGLPTDPQAAPSLIDELAQAVTQLRSAQQDPKALVLVGNGYASQGNLSWLNSALFPRDPVADCAQVQVRQPGVLVRAPLPGDRMWLRHGTATLDRETHAAIEVLPQEAWPPHKAAANAGTHDLPAPPALGPAQLQPEQWHTLDQELCNFAGYLYGTSLLRDWVGQTGPWQGATPGLALWVDDLSGPVHYVWSPQACAFDRVAGPAPAYGEVLRLWSCDLLAMVTGKLAATRVLMGRIRVYSNDPQQPFGRLFMTLYHYLHPLRWPDRQLAAYQARAAALAPRSIILRHHRTQP
jgi:hypothetical protein